MLCWKFKTYNNSSTIDGSEFLSESNAEWFSSVRLESNFSMIFALILSGSIMVFSSSFTIVAVMTSILPFLGFSFFLEPSSFIPTNCLSKLVLSFKTVKDFRLETEGVMFLEAGISVVITGGSCFRFSETSNSFLDLADVRKSCLTGSAVLSKTLFNGRIISA